MMHSSLAWLQSNKERLLILCGILLVGALSFEAGLLEGRAREVRPLTLSIPAVPADTHAEIETPQKDKSATAPAAQDREPVVAVVGAKKDCLFVGSKNSNKYHAATCAVAKRIKPENKVCFASQEEAVQRGYIQSCLK